MPPPRHKPADATVIPLWVRFPDPADAARHIVRVRGIGRAKSYAATRMMTCGDSKTEWWTDVMVSMRLILEPCELPAND